MADEPTNPDPGTVNPIEKYDSEHGKYVDGMSNPPTLPNAAPAGPDPSPFKVGGI